ncbi:MAG: ribosome-binding factor [Clostridia bacterium]|nr:ribosome-binding factor [Clostridia bacterium]
MKKEIARILRDELKDPRLVEGLVTVTGVELSNDLHYAKVYVSIYGKEELKSEIMKTLTNAVGFVRREISKSLSLRYTPEITFKFDKSLEHGDYINRLLNKVMTEEKNDDND